MTTLGRKEDAAGFPFISIESGPFMTMVTMGVAGIASFPWQALVSTLIPFVVGIALGSLDHSFRKLFGPMVPALVPFLRLYFRLQPQLWYDPQIRLRRYFYGLCGRLSFWRCPSLR